MEPPIKDLLTGVNRRSSAVHNGQTNRTAPPTNEMKAKAAQMAQQIHKCFNNTAQGGRPGAPPATRRTRRIIMAHHPMHKALEHRKEMINLWRHERHP